MMARIGAILAPYIVLLVSKRADTIQKYIFET